MAESNRDSSVFLIGFILGAAGGIAAALMTTPRSGEETMEQIAGRFRGVKAQVNEGVDQVRQYGDQFRQQAVEQTQHGLHDVRAKLDARGRDLHGVPNGQIEIARVPAEVPNPLEGIEEGGDQAVGASQNMEAATSAMNLEAKEAALDQGQIDAEALEDASAQAMPPDDQSQGERH